MWYSYINGRKIVDAPPGFTHTFNTEKHRGKAYEYIVVAAKMLGRDIGKDEVVHHRNGDKADNRESNLMVLESNATHTTLHRHQCDETILQKKANGAYALSAEFVESRKHIRQDCGSPLGKLTGDTICTRGSAARARKFSRPGSLELADLVWSMPMVKVAEKFGASDNTIRKWCKSAGIVWPPMGYWLSPERGADVATKCAQNLHSAESVRESTEGVKRYYQTHRSPCVKPVEQLDKVTGAVIRLFPGGCREAERNGFISGQVSACCLGKRKTHKGYRWRYAAA